MHPDLQSIMFDETAINAKLQELGAAITGDYQDKISDENPLVVCGILRGASVFTADLIRRLDLPIELDFMRVSSYGLSSQTSGQVNIKKDMETDIKNRHLLIVEDIVDSGITMDRLIAKLKERQPASVKFCALLSKPSRRKVNLKIDYLGWEVPDEFIVGYGLDYAERYRNLPVVGILSRTVYS